MKSQFKSEWNYQVLLGCRIAAIAGVFETPSFVGSSPTAPANLQAVRRDGAEPPKLSLIGSTPILPAIFLDSTQSKPSKTLNLILGMENRLNSNASITQLAEYPAFTRQVGGSTPSGRTILPKLNNQHRQGFI